jgi:hypothetical protein
VCCACPDFGRVGRLFAFDDEIAQVIAPPRVGNYCDVQSYPSTFDGEQFGLDDIRITADNGATTIATENFEGGGDQIGYFAEGEGGAGGAFWGLVTPGQAGFSPRVTDPRPIITYEDALYDEFGVSSPGSRLDGTTIEIEDPDHVLAAGLSGSVPIYDFAQGITQLGDSIAPGAHVVATHASVPVITVLERGAEDVTGNAAPGQRITIFAHDSGDPNAYTELGWTLLEFSVIYAEIFGGVQGDPDGDFNGDGELNEADALVNEIVLGNDNPDFDVTGDGIVDNAALDLWLADGAEANGFAEPYRPGDANLDGVVDAQDLNELALSWQGNPNTWTGGDFTADGAVNAGDLNLLGLNWQSTIALAAPASPSAVPEPSAWAVALVLAGGGFLGVRRDRADKSARRRKT